MSHAPMSLAFLSNWCFCCVYRCYLLLRLSCCQQHHHHHHRQPASQLAICTLGRNRLAHHRHLNIIALLLGRQLPPAHRQRAQRRRQPLPRKPLLRVPAQQHPVQPGHDPRRVHVHAAGQGEGPAPRVQEPRRGHQVDRREEGRRLTGYRRAVRGEVGTEQMNKETNLTKVTKVTSDEGT